MKRISQIICMLLVLSVIFVNPVFAADNATWESSYFGSRLAYLHPTIGTSFQVWIEVDAIRTMDELGASSITVQRSSDDSNWTDMRTYTKEDYSQLICENSVAHAAYVAYTGTSGYYYRAKVWFYAKKGTGTAEYEYTTESIYVS